MFALLKDAVSVVRRVVADLDPRHLSAFDAGHWSKRSQSWSAWLPRALAGRRVEKSYLWREEGFRTPSEWMAAKAQTTRSAAISTIETGRGLDELPETRDALRAGSLSAVQAADITAAASTDPRAEESLLETARTESVLALQTRCREVVAAASKDLDRDERLHRARYLRHWTDREGSIRVDARLAPDAGAKLVARSTWRRSSSTRTRARPIRRSASRRLGRSIPARLAAALEARDQVCAVPGCDRRHDLQNHHTKPYVQTKHARLSELARVCTPHHKLIPHHGWILDGEPGSWNFHKHKRVARPSRE